MTSDSQGTLERIAHRLSVPEPAYARLLRRRDRKERNRRISAAVLVVGLALLSITGLVRAFDNSGRPASKPTPTPVDRGIFSRVGGWIAYGDAHHGTDGVWAVDPERPGHPHSLIRLSTQPGEPLAWSRDGTELLILTHHGHALSVLNADGSETLLIDAPRRGIGGGTFSPDGAKVIYASGSGIYLVDAGGGTPRRLLEGRRLPTLGPQVRLGLWDPAFSPDGSKIAYFEGLGDWGNSLRVMNADGSGSRDLLKSGLIKSAAGLGYLSWSPDGRRLVFAMGYGPYSIYVVGANGSGLTQVIGTGRHPEWSPNGARIAFDQVLGCCDEGGLSIADADGTNVQTFNYGASGPWNPLDRAELRTRDTSVNASAARPDRLSYAIAALAAIGILVLWLRRKRRTWAEVKETTE